MRPCSRSSMTPSDCWSRKPSGPSSRHSTRTRRSNWKPGSGARNKYVGQYRRAASAAVAEHGGRGKARPENTTARMKAEAFEEALSRVSGRVATLARQAAQQLRAERLAAARAVKQSRGPSKASPGQAAGAAVTGTQNGPTATGEPAGARPLRTPASEKRRAGTKALGARRQAKRDSR